MGLDTGAPPYLLEPLDLVLQLHLAGPAGEVGQAGGGAPPAGPLRLQPVQLQVLQLPPQVLDQLHTHQGDTPGR